MKVSNKEKFIKYCVIQRSSLGRKKENNLGNFHVDIEAEMSEPATPLVHGANIPHLTNDR